MTVHDLLACTRSTLKQRGITVRAPEGRDLVDEYGVNGIYDVEVQRELAASYITSLEKQGFLHFAWTLHLVVGERRL